MRSQKRPSRSGLSVRYLIVSGFVTSPIDQSRICFGEASPIRIASKSLMSICAKCLFASFSQSEWGRSLLAVELEVCQLGVAERADLRVGLLLGLLLGRDLHVLEVAERLV